MSLCLRFPAPDSDTFAEHYCARQPLLRSTKLPSLEPLVFDHRKDLPGSTPRSRPVPSSREYQIPAVLDTGVSTERIRSGQRITVDGDGGVVMVGG
jgi:hypothetical protein